MITLLILITWINMSSGYSIIWNNSNYFVGQSDQPVSPFILMTTYTSANGYCIAHSSDLVSIHNREEDVLIRDIIANVSSGTLLGAWLGLYKRTGRSDGINCTNNWNWTDGSPYNYKNENFSINCGALDKNVRLVTTSEFFTWKGESNPALIQLVICKKAQPCASSPCINGTCVSTSNIYTCSCNPGYTGKLCEQIQPCYSSPCAFGHCDANSSGYKCTCGPGYTGLHCTDVVTEISATASIPFLISPSDEAPVPHKGDLTKKLAIGIPIAVMILVIILVIVNCVLCRKLRIVSRPPDKALPPMPAPIKTNITGRVHEDTISNDYDSIRSDPSEAQISTTTKTSFQYEPIC